MTEVRKTQPLQQRLAIVDPNTGQPSDYFMKYIALHGGAITDVDALVLELQAQLGAKADKITQINTGTGLDGGGNLSANRTIILKDTAVTPGTYGSSTKSPVITVDQQGRLTGVTEATISGGGGGGGGGWDFNPPSTSVFSVIDSGDATNLTLTDDSDVGLIATTPLSASGVLRAAFKPLTTKSADWTLLTKMSAGPFTPDYLNTGVLIRDSVSGRAIRFSMTTDYGIYVVTDNSLSSYNSIPYQASGNLRSLKEEYWFKITKTSSNLVFSLSPNGKTWEDVYSMSPSSWLTNLPDQVGFYIATVRGTGQPSLTIPYWSLTGPAV